MSSKPDQTATDTIAPCATDPSFPLTPVYAAIDIGSGSVRLNLFGIDSNGQIKKIDVPDEEMSRDCNLAKGMAAENPVIKIANLAKAVTILRSFDCILKRFDIKPENICAVATEAVRAAPFITIGNEEKNVIDILTNAFGGREIKVVTEEEEALLVAEAVKLGMNGWSENKGKPIDIAFAAIGGGSLETGVIKADGSIKNTVTLHYGVHRLITASGGVIDKAGKILNAALRLHYHRQHYDVLAVVGGNWRSLGQAICGELPATLEDAQVREKLLSATHRPEKWYRQKGGRIADRAPYMRLSAAMLRRVAERFHAKKVVFLKTTIRDAMAEIMLRRDQSAPIPDGLARLFCPSAPTPTPRA